MMDKIILQLVDMLHAGIRTDDFKSAERALRAICALIEKPLPELPASEVDNSKEFVYEHMACTFGKLGQLCRSYEGEGERE